MGVSALPPKADVLSSPYRCPLSANSRHSAVRVSTRFAIGCRRSPEREFALRCRPWDFLRLPAMACSQSGSVAGEHKVMSYGPRHLHAKDLVYVWRGGCGLWAGSVSYLNIFATMGPPTRGFSSASSASALSFS